MGLWGVDREWLYPQVCVWCVRFFGAFAALPLLKMIEQKKDSYSLQVLDFLCNKCATRKTIKNAFSNLQDLKRRMDTGA
jgi:hypothetical protein